MTSEAQCWRHGTVFSFSLDKQKSRTCLRGSRSTPGLLLLPAPPQAPFLFSTWPPTWRVHSHMWQDLGMQLLPYSSVLPTGLGSGLALGSLLSWLEGFSASNSENAGSGSQISRMLPTSSLCRENSISLVHALLSQPRELSALKEQEQRQFCPQQPHCSLSSHIVQNFCLHFIFTPIRRLEVFFLLLFIILLLSRLVCQLLFAIFTACCIWEKSLNWEEGKTLWCLSHCNLGAFAVEFTEHVKGRQQPQGHS